MIRLQQTFGAHTGRVLELDRDVIRFGRLPDNEVSFDPHADLDASGRHAELRRENGAWVLVDVGSRNGTLVGGKRITRHELRSGEEIEFGLGGPRVRVEIVGAAAPSIGGSRPGVATAAATPIAPMPSPTPPPSPFGGAPSPMPSSPRLARSRWSATFSSRRFFSSQRA
jgi:predicted component of type VI protein secretion system